MVLVAALSCQLPRPVLGATLGSLARRRFTSQSTSRISRCRLATMANMYSGQTHNIGSGPEASAVLYPASRSYSRQTANGQRMDGSVTMPTTTFTTIRAASRRVLHPMWTHGYNLKSAATAPAHWAAYFGTRGAAARAPTAFTTTTFVGTCKLSALA